MNTFGIDIPLSHSSISTYEECPRKFYMQYIMRAPKKAKYFFSFGQSLHSTLEFFYAEAKPPRLEALMAAYDCRWIDEGYRGPQHTAECYAEGRDIIKRFWDKHAATYKRPLHVELKFKLQVAGVLMTGKIDRIDAKKTGLLVLDYKTGKKLDPQRILADEQMTLYQIATEAMLKQKVDTLALYHLPTLGVIGARRRKPALVKALETKIRKVAKLIAEEKYPVNPEDTRCKWCDHRDTCPAQRAGVKEAF